MKYRRGDWNPEKTKRFWGRVGDKEAWMDPDRFVKAKQHTAEVSRIAGYSRELYRAEKEQVLLLQLEQAKNALELISCPARPNGTFQRSRLACQRLAKSTLEKLEKINAS
jgi:hypothetical protein